MLSDGNIVLRPRKLQGAHETDPSTARCSMTNRAEHRRGQRVATAMWLRLGSGGAELGMGNLADVSISGAFLETSIKLPVNANITLEPLTSAGVALDDLKLSARVA